MDIGLTAVGALVEDYFSVFEIGGSDIEFKRILGKSLSVERVEFVGDLVIAELLLKKISGF